MLSMSFSLIMRSMLNLLCLNSVPSSIKRLIYFSSDIFIGKTADDSPYFRTPSYRDFSFFSNSFYFVNKRGNNEE